MLRLSRFEYVAPTSVNEAVALLHLHGTNAVLLAGGTDVLVNIKHRVCRPSHLIAIRHLPEMQGIRSASNGGIDIGAGVTLRALEFDPHICGMFPALAHAAHLVSTPQVRTTATIGGNICLDVRCNYYNQSYEWRKGIGFCMKKDSPICRVAPGGDRCWAVASADTVPVLIALRAVVTIVGENGTREIPLEDLYQDDGLVPLTLRFGEIVIRVHLPPPDGYACSYQKFRIRQSFDFPLVGVAVALRTMADGTVEDARIVMTAVGSLPQRAPEAESLLVGRRLDENCIGAAGQSVFRLARPMDNTAGTIFHRKRMARVLMERAIREAGGIRQSDRQLA